MVAFISGQFVVYFDLNSHIYSRALFLDRLVIMAHLGCLSLSFVAH
jgi:hypothetical protein